jgi:DNA repair photolyase
MRWENLTIAAEEGTRLPGYRDPAVVRRFDAPEALDTRFYEIHAKSVLNRVPEQSRMPFRWTVNPYRGCSHACVYCLDPDTPVLCADGSQKPIGELAVGEAIVGTERRGRYRRFVETEVRDRWQTVKPAYRVVLADGTRLVASGDHRFLTSRGWKHVTGAEQGRARRPHLTLNSKLLGLGQLPATPPRTEDYELGSKADLCVVAIETVGTRRLVDITTGTGDFIANGVVSHNCFARPTHTYLGFDADRDFEKEIVVKVNAPEVLRAQLRKPSWTGEHVAMGTNTDPYQWVESKYRLMPGIWEALRDARNPCSILTKSPLLLRDKELMLEIAAVTTITASLSIPTIDRQAWRASEPHTPSPWARMEAVAELNRIGIPTGILIAPLMPGINDEPRDVEKILAAAGEAGAVSVGGIALHLRGEVRGVFMEWLRSYRPDLVDHYEQLYARGAYAPQEERRRLSALLRRPGAPPETTFDRDPMSISPPHAGGWRRVGGKDGAHSDASRARAAGVQEALF